MEMPHIARVISTTFLSLAAALVAYGVFGLSRFVESTGGYVDERLFIFDNGVYPFIFGVVLLLVGQLARLHHRQRAMMISAGAAIAVLMWKRFTVPAAIAGQEIFPDIELLNQLMLMALVVLVLAFADPYIATSFNAIFKRSR